jgi:glycosyltransferase involved in cell wall biosynthesis
MVTRDRAGLARRAVACLAAQTWPRLELVVVSDGGDGDDAYSPILEDVSARLSVRHVRLGDAKADRRLGELRNVALDEARGDLLVQWDDDEWYHPDRIARQVAALGDAAGVILHTTLVHVDSPELRGRAFRGACTGGTPGTILHRRTPARYPNLPRAEDTHFLRQLKRRGGVRLLGPESSHLFIRCYHGRNTWDARQFMARLWRTPGDLARYLVARHVLGDVTRHPAFRLDGRERDAVSAFLDDTRRAGLTPA